MRIYLIRHAESQSNVQESLLKTIADRDIDITANGKAQASRVAQWMASFIQAQPDHTRVELWHSPYKRTTETAKPVIAALETQIPGFTFNNTPHNELLREQNLGDFAGHTLEEREKLFPEKNKRFQDAWFAGKSYDAPRPNGESRKDVADRMDQIIPEIQKAADSGVTDLVIVGHGIAHRLLLKQLLGMSVEQFEKEPNLGNTHVRMLEMQPDKTVEDRGYIYTNHIQAGHIQAGQAAALGKAQRQAGM